MVPYMMSFLYGGHQGAPPHGARHPTCIHGAPHGGHPDYPPIALLADRRCRFYYTHGPTANILIVYRLAGGCLGP